MTKRILPVILALSAATLTAHAQEGPVSTQTLITVESKAAPQLTASQLTVRLNNQSQPLASLTPVLPSGAQVALLIDDGLRNSVGREINGLRSFVGTLEPGIEVLIGYMQNGRIVVAQPFTQDHALAAQSLRIPEGMPGSSASPYFCLSDFVKKWPGEPVYDRNEPMPIANPASPHKARFVLMITNGVDPYNGSTSLMNQDSPYVETAVKDSQRAGVAVYSIYYSDAGIGGARASFSGQSYLQQLSDGTGGTAFYEGTGNPVSMAPFLTQFKRDVAETYIATFQAPEGKDMLRFKVSTTLPKTKLHAPDEIQPGNQE